MSVLVLLGAMLAGRVDTLVSGTLMNFVLGDREVLSLATRGSGSQLSAGYASIRAASGTTTPDGLAVFGFRQNGVLVTEAGVPASPLMRRGRIFVEVAGPVNTGIAIANPGSRTANISFAFTDSAGIDSGAGTLQIPAGQQIARFLNQSPFSAAQGSLGSFSFNSDADVAVIALRGLNNQRNEFLITTLPVIDLSGAADSQPVLLPHFADGGGWSTQIVLLNPGDTTLTGSVVFTGPGSGSTPGQPVNVAIGGTTGSNFAYTVPPRTSIRMQTAGLATGTTQSGSVRVSPGGGTRTPAAQVIFSFQNNGVTVTEAGVSALRASTSLRMYAEGNPAAGSIQTGIALANPSQGPVPVTVELTDLQGKPVGSPRTLTIPGNGQTAQFLDQILPAPDGVRRLPGPYQGVLRISTTATAGVSVVGLRGRTNERGDFLITTTPTVDENSPPSSSEALFPHFADSGGWTTQFVLFTGRAGQASAGELRFFGQSGAALDLQAAGGDSDLSVVQSGPPSCSITNNECNAITFVATVANNGPQTASAVSFTNRLPVDPPTGAPVASLQAARTAQGTCSVPTGGIFRCDLGAIPAGGRVTVTTIATVDATAIGRVITNQATVGSNTNLDSSGANNLSAQDLRVTPTLPQTDLEVTSLDGPASASTYQDLTYTAKIVNRGPSTATFVTTRYAVPPGVNYRSVTTTQGTCAYRPHEVTCNLGTLPRGVTQTISIVVQAINLGFKSHTLTISSSATEPRENDPNASNNSKTRDTTIY